MVQIGRRRLFAPMAIPAMALLQQYDARRDILNELVARWRAAIESVTVVYYGQMVGWIKMKLGVQVGLGPGDFVLRGYPAPPSPQFSAHVYCDQAAGWIKMALGMEVGLDPGHVLLDGDPALLPKRGQTPNFRPIFIVAKRLGGSKFYLVRR